MGPGLELTYDRRMQDGRASWQPNIQTRRLGAYEALGRGKPQGRRQDCGDALWDVTMRALKVLQNPIS